MNNAKNGVILLSLGTNIRSATLKDEIKQTFLKALAKLPQTVLWKFETEDLKNIPKNVITRKWLPQNDILGSLLMPSAIIILISKQNRSSQY